MSKTERLPRPPAHVARYVDALGPDAAFELLMHFGGADLYIAEDPKGRSELVAVIGIEGARALAEVADRLPRRVPTGKPWLAAMLRAKGLSKAAIARKLHSTDVSVRKWLADFEEAKARAAGDDRQLPLL